MSRRELPDDERSGDEIPFADVEIGAAARAKSLRFNRKPHVEVDFETGEHGESETQTERENLPEEVEPGVTYRDVRVAWRGGARVTERRNR